MKRIPRLRRAVNAPAVRQMSTGRQELAAKKESGIKASELLSFSSAILGIIATAIFYYTGWVYVSHWYGYYGIDASHINPSLQLILIHGVPGVLVLVAAGLLSTTGIAVYRNMIQHTAISISDLPTIVTFAYFSSAIVILLIALSLPLGVKIPIEVDFSLVTLGICWFIYFVVNYILYALSLLSGRGIYVSTIRVPLGPATMAAIITMIQDASERKDYVRLSKILSPRPDPDIKQEIERRQMQFTASLQTQSTNISGTISLTQRFWIIALFIFYFLVSISTSALLGEWDAARGGRFMIGDWRIPELVVYSQKPIGVLSPLLTSTGISNTYEYRNLGLLASDDKLYYLVDWKKSMYYMSKPNVYWVPHSDDLSFIVHPYNLPPSLLQFPLTRTITLTVTPSVTPILPVASPTP